jgi:hypothetical protein
MTTFVAIYDWVAVSIVASLRLLGGRAAKFSEGLLWRFDSIIPLLMRLSEMFFTIALGSRNGAIIPRSRLACHIDR